MQIYNYNQITGEYVSTSEADVSPLEPGVFLIPANATTIDPPDAIEGKANCFRDGNWVLVDDLRGKDLWNINTQQKIIAELGENKPEWTELRPLELPCVWEDGVWVVDTVKIKENTKVTLISTVQSHLDSSAQAKGYDDIKSAVTYIDDEDSAFSADGLAFKRWRSRCWRKCYEIMAEVMAGTRQVPTEAELIEELPKLTL